MRHIDGIKVYLKQSDGNRYGEYHSPYEIQQDASVGCIGSRLVAGASGESFEVVVRFDEDFKIFRASGVFIGVAIGDKTERLDSEENYQCFWLPRGDCEPPQEYSFKSFVAWRTERRPNVLQQYSMEMPAADGKLPIFEARVHMFTL